MDVWEGWSVLCNVRLSSRLFGESGLVCGVCPAPRSFTNSKPVVCWQMKGELAGQGQVLAVTSREGECSHREMPRL